MCACPTLQGMPIDSSVAELLTAQLFVLVQDAPDPIYMYINSTGIAVRRLAALGQAAAGAVGAGFGHGAVRMQCCCCG